MKKLASFIILFSMAATAVTAQKKLSHNNNTVTEWAEKPAIHDLPPQYKHESAILLLHDVTLDYRYEGKGINVYYTQHRIAKIIDDRGIEMFNKVMIPVGSRTRVPLIKARTILPDGKIMDIAKDMIKVTKNEFGQYEIVFAMEGLVKDAEVELLIKEIKPWSAFGSQIFQYQVPVASTRFEIDYPNDIVFDEKSYNGFPDGKDILLHNRRHISIEEKDIPALKDEPDAFYELHCQRAEYRVHKFINENRPDTARILTWDHMAREIFDEHYKFTKEDRAAVNKYLITLGVHPTDDDDVNVRKIEDGIKNNIVLYQYLDGEKSDALDSIIKNKAATASGYLKLFAACFTQAEVKHELGMAYNRKESHFDRGFENWGNMDNYLFYFPNLGKYISPLSVYMRYPITPDEVLGIKGVFCVIPPKHDNYGPMAKVRTIKSLDADASQDNIAAGVTFTKDMNADIDISYSYTGYAATGLRQALMLEPKNKEKEIVRKVVSVSDKPEDIKKYTISNAAINSSYTNAPLEITASVNTSELTQKAGKNYLFKLGELAGPHSSLYYEKKRVLPIDRDYPETMTRTFTINIPKGYKVMNPEAIKMQADYVDFGLKPVISFNSDYKLTVDKKNGDKLVVTVKEYCPKTHFATSEYEKYRKVVNTAADFNKVTLLLTKKG